MKNIELQRHANHIRKNILDMVYAAQSGHPGGSLSATDLMTYLYFEELNITKENIGGLDRNRFVLSKGHASPVLYGTLTEAGLIDEDLKSFRQLNTKLQGHPSMKMLKGVDMSTGSLGQGASVSVGMAIANKLDNNGHNIYTLVGDGESEEGIIYEAMMAASHYKLDNLCFILDLNHLQIDGRIEDVMNPTPHKEKFEAFGWKVAECDGHNFDSIRQAFDIFHNTKEQPTVIIAHTVKGKGISFMENNAGWHGVAPKEDEYHKALAELDEMEAKLND